MMQTFQMYRTLTREIHGLFLAKIIIAAGNLVYPFLTLYLTNKLHVSTDKVGVLLGIATIGSLLGTLFGGTLADFFSRKSVLISSLFLSATCYVLVAFLNNAIAIIILLLLGLTFASGSIPAYNAMIADITDKRQRRAAFSLLYMGSNIGFTVGPLIAAYFFTDFVQLIFIGDALATIASIMLINRFVKGKITGFEDSTEKVNSGLREKGFYEALSKHSAVMAFLIIFSLHPFIFSQVFFSLPLHMNTLFGDKGIHYYGTIIMLNGISVIVLTPLVTRMSQGIKPILSVATGGLLYAAGFGILFFARDFLWICISTIVWSVGEILSTTNSEVYVSEQALPSHRARLNMLLEINYEMGFGLGPFVMGYFIARQGVLNVWPVMTSIAVLSSVLLAIVYLSQTREHPQDRESQKQETGQPGRL